MTTKPKTEKTKILFDMTEPQTVSMNVPFQNTTVPVSHVLNFPDDKRIKAYYKERKVEEVPNRIGYLTSLNLVFTFSSNYYF